LEDKLRNRSFEILEEKDRSFELIELLEEG
jgi:hypothetical protein